MRSSRSSKFSNLFQLSPSGRFQYVAVGRGLVSSENIQEATLVVLFKRFVERTNGSRAIMVSIFPVRACPARGQFPRLPVRLLGPDPVCGMLWKCLSRLSLLSGKRTVRACSAMDCRTDCLIHQTA